MVPIIQQTVYARGDLQFMQKGAVSRKVVFGRMGGIKQVWMQAGKMYISVSRFTAW